MAEVSIDRYVQALRAIDEDCADGVAKVILDYVREHPDASVEEIRQFAISVGVEALDVYSSASIYAADSIFDEVMAAEDVAIPMRAELVRPSHDGVERAAHYQVGNCDTLERFAEQMGDAVAYYARDAARRESMAQVERARHAGTKRDIRFARVPAGIETCTYCTMLASRGFDYRSAESAGHANHRGCDCVIVPGVKDSTTVAGYDTKELYDRWRRYEEIDARDDLNKHEKMMLKRALTDERVPYGAHEPDGVPDRFLSCVRTVEHDLRPGWERMTEDEQRAYTGGFDGYCMDRAVAEMNTRDRHWLETGEPVPIDYSEKSREQYGEIVDPSLPLPERYALSNITGDDNEIRDVFVHDMLSQNGFSVTPHKTVRDGGSSNIDISIGDQLWEIKSATAKPLPESKDELKFVQRDIQKARHQFRRDGVPDNEWRVILSNYYTEFPADDEERIFDRFCREVHGQGFADGLFVKKDGTILRA